jgi:hypothetical protein
VTFFFTTVLSDTRPLKHLTILIMVTRIEQLFVAHNSPANRRITEGETNIADNKFWTDTCSLGYPIKRYNDTFFPTSDPDRRSDPVANLKAVVSRQA